MFTFNDNRKSINEIYKMFEQENLFIDESYQRRSVWNEKDKIRLVETVLLNFIIPELFFWKAETDPETGDSITHIVDGQQRIKAICSFVNNEYRLKKSFLLDNTIKERYGDKKFSEFDDDTRKRFWNYQLMVIEIDSNANRNDIVTMFNRLNLTDYSLNAQEKRNSKSGEFATLSRKLAENPIWDKYGLFTGTDIRRMKDIEFCSSILLLYRDGIIDQTDQSALNKAYEELQVGYNDAEKDERAFYEAIEIIQTFFANDLSLKFLRKKTQLYTLFSVVFYTQRNKIKIKKENIDNFHNFTQLYSSFNNDIELKDGTKEEREIFDLLKKYKLASSEGLNKHTNRMIRYNVMKTFIFYKRTNLSRTILSLMEKLTNNSI